LHLEQVELNVAKVCLVVRHVHSCVRGLLTSNYTMLFLGNICKWRDSRNSFHPVT
jgi:hypothetical protein